MTTSNSNTEEEKFSLRVLIDHSSNKVLFAEADNDFVDVLFSFMTLPLGTIVRLTDQHLDQSGGAIGSLNNLYDSLKKLSNSCFWTEEAKLMLLNPRNCSLAECQKLKLNVDDTEPIKYYICENMGCQNSSTAPISTFNVTRCMCGKLLKKELDLKYRVCQSGKGGFTPSNACFIIKDDLQVTPNVIGSSFELLESLGIEDTAGLEDKRFKLGLKEIIYLLKLSMISKTPLTDMFLPSNPLKSKTFYSASSHTRQDPSADSRKMALKVIVFKSTKKVLFAEAGEDFIDFLFSMLAIPLGSAVSLLDGKTSLSIDNLYKSISCLETERYLKSEDVRNMLLSPKLPPQYLSKNQIFVLSEKPTPSLFYNVYLVNASRFVYLSDQTSPKFVSRGTINHPVTIEDPKVNESFFRGPAVYMVTDDLQVTQLSSISSFYFLKKSGISLCDVKEVVLNIGIEEALGILNASLTTTSALTKGLKQMLIKCKELE